jgi:hypothetical protein
LIVSDGHELARELVVETRQDVPRSVAVSGAHAGHAEDSTHDPFELVRLEKVRRVATTMMEYCMARNGGIRLYFIREDEDWRNCVARQQFPVVSPAYASSL